MEQGHGGPGQCASGSRDGNAKLNTDKTQKVIAVHSGSDGCHEAKGDSDLGAYDHIPKDYKGIVYTCPMHPQVREVSNTGCPICGMALEPETVSIDALDDDSEYKDMRLRFWVCLFFALPLFLIAMSEMMPSESLKALSQKSFMPWLQMALATPVVLWGAAPFFRRGWQSVKNRSPNMFTLISLGVITAYTYSVIATIAPQIFPDSFRGPSGSVAVYFEAAAVIVTLVLLGQVLELRARSQTSGAIRALLELTPPTAIRLSSDGSQEEISVDAIMTGDRLRLRPGDKVPVDGRVVLGRSQLDEAMLTGEPMPVEKLEGNTLSAGTVNGTGSLVMEVTQTGDDTLLAHIVRLVSQAQRSQVKIQRLVDIVSKYFVIAVLISAAITFTVWAVWGPQPSMSYALLNMIAVLIVACPCALGLATPMSIMVGTGKGAHNGILVKDAQTLETFEKVTHLIVDKTGTLTKGAPELVTIHAASGISEDELLSGVAAVEMASEHPLAQALVGAAKDRGLEFTPATEFQSVTGEGVTGLVNGRQIGIGNSKLMKGLGAYSEALASAADSYREQGQTVMFISINGAPVGFIGVTDPIKPSTPAAIKSLRESGLKLIMVTGDSAATAQAVARQLGIDEVHADASPEDKYQIVTALQDAAKLVAMAGDGINDAPALAQANVGIAMGTGTDIAMESAGMTLVRGDLMGISKARHLSQATMRNIRENLFFAFIYNGLSIPLAAGVLYPAYGILLNPMIAAGAMSLSSVSVIANALRLRALKL